MGKKDSSSSSSSSSEEEKKEKKDKKEKKEKVVKAKKPKVVIATNATLSKRYSYLFNNKQFSDLTVKIGNDSYFAHKFILGNNSEFFEKLEGDSFSFANEDDAAAAKSLIKFYYDGVFEYTEESAVVIFTLLANKYKTKNFAEFKLPAKVLLNGVITYVEKDLTNRVNEFDSLCQSVDFKKMEQEDLLKLYQKRKWLWDSPSFQNQIIKKSLEDDDEEEGSDKESGSDKEEEEEDTEDSDKSEEETEESEESEEEGKAKIKKSELVGCNTSGSAFDDNPKYKKKLTGITVWGTSYLDAIQLHWGKEKGQIYGSQSGSPVDFVLKKGERFTKAEITFSTSDIFSLALWTNKGNTKKWGGTGTSSKVIEFKKGLVNISGELSTYPRKLQFHYKK